MMQNLLRSTLLIFSAASLLAGCSTSNGEAPAGAHPANWYHLHRATTTSTVFVSECGGCHVVKNLPGPAVPPSCFSVSFDGRSCHANGPGQAPHPMDGSFLQGSVHGKAAKADLTFCQACHSSDPMGGAGSNPRFNVGIFNTSAPAPGTGCEQCHGVNYAHPAQWAGPNATFHYSAKNVQEACALCHGAALDGVGGVGVSCKNCHNETTSFSLNCTSCHGFPPDGVTPEPVVAAEGGSLVNHLPVPLGSHDQCATCHGVKSTSSGLVGNLITSANYLAFDKTTDTIGDHWNGKINMNSQVGYNTANFGCDMACHVNDASHQLTDSSLPVTLGNYGAGTAGHTVGAGWLLKSAHATQAVNATLNCLGCHSLSGGQVNPPCLGCHQVAPRMDLTNNGCTSCHSITLGPDGVNPVATQPNRAGKHGEHVVMTADTGNCSACHLGGGSNSLSHYDRIDQTTPKYPADVNFLATYKAKSGAASYDTTAQSCSKVSCHGGLPSPNWYNGALPSTSPTVSNAYCLSCHTSGTAEYNGYHSGQHSKHVDEENQRCVWCHNVTVLQNGVGGAGPTHWSNLNTSAFELAPLATIGGAGTRIVSFDGTTCANACHGNRTW